MYQLLVVDDKEVFCRMITRMSYFKENPNKFKIKRLARNGIEALDILKSDNIDIVLTDIRMPLMSGIELLKEINARDLCRCTILLSEYSDFNYAKEGIINGAFDYIVKPVDDQKLKETFDRAYKYLENSAAKETPLNNSIQKLADSIYQEDRIFEIMLESVVDNIKQNSDSYAKMVVVINTALEQFCNLILLNYPYAEDYIPIKQICKITLLTHSSHDLMDLFVSKMKFLQKELLKFKLASSSTLVQEIWYYVIANIESDSKLQNIAETFYINKKYLSFLFKKETGMKYIDFITYFKIERAKMLITYSNFKIYTIAEMLGFNDPEYFSRIFKKQTGVTPKNFNWNHLV